MLFWIILTMVGAAGWVTFVIFAVLTGGHFKLAVNFFSILMLISIPVGLLIEFLRYLKRKQ